MCFLIVVLWYKVIDIYNYVSIYINKVRVFVRCCRGKNFKIVIFNKVIYVFLRLFFVIVNLYFKCELKVFLIFEFIVYE